MLIYNIFCFGHRIADNEKLNNLLFEFDLEISKKINNKKWEISFPHHSIQISGAYSCLFGTEITSDYNNPNFINIVRLSDVNNYLHDYNLFLSQVISNFESIAKLEPEFKQVVDILKEFIENNKADFYLVEVLIN